MSHEIHQTKAMILRSKGMRESNRLLVLYTEDFGLVYVSAQSIRDIKSKMRFHISRLSLVTVDLVEGRDVWRLTGIHEEVSSMTFADSPWYPMLDRIASVVLRLCRGEEANQALWNDLAFLYDLVAGGNQDQRILDTLEIAIVARILYHVGYWSGDEDIVMRESSEIMNYLTEVDHHRTSFIKRINQGIEASQL